MRLPARLVALALALAPVACATTQTLADEDAAPGPNRCDEAATPLDLEDDAALGFAAAEVLARFGGVRLHTLEHYAGESSELTLELKLLEAALVTTDYPEGVEPGDEPELDCGATRMRLEVGLVFRTADGVFDELLVNTWELEGLDTHASILLDLPIDEVAGAHSSDADYLSFNITLAEDGAWGSVVGVIMGDDGVGSEFNVARFNQDTWPQSEP